MSKHYEYIGPKEILNQIQPQFKGTVISTLQDIYRWIMKHLHNSKVGEVVICTFIINLEGQLVIADRHSEHVQCAFGEAVKSAGEIVFLIEKGQHITIDSITNQSTGYCPSADSWKAVEAALKKIDGLNIPNGFEPEFVFSYCPNCETRQIVREAFYYCPMCEGALLSEVEFQEKRRYLTFR